MASVSASYTFVVTAAPLALTSQAPPSAMIGAPYHFTFTASGGVAPYVWTMSPSIPGLSLNSASGVLSGTPTSLGTTEISVTLTDSST